MTPDELAIVQSTFAEVRSWAAAVSAAFYRNLFADHPELRELFPDDLDAQQRKFVDELDAIVEAVTDLDRLLERTLPLGQRHVAYGARASHYKLVGDALLAALAGELGDRWTADTEDAWMRAYRLVAETMLQGAQADRTPT